MSKPVMAVCDNEDCGKIADVNYKKAKHLNGIEETYFECEHCFQRYTCFVTDTWVRKQHRRNNGAVVSDEKVNERMSELKFNLINFGRADL